MTGPRQATGTCPVGRSRMRGDRHKMTPRQLGNSIIATLVIVPALLFVWHTINVATDMLSEEPPVVRWASEMEPLDMSEDKR